MRGRGRGGEPGRTIFAPGVRWGLGAGAFLVAYFLILPPGLDAQDADDDVESPFELNLSARLQVRHTVSDPSDGDRTASTRIRRARLALSGAAYGDFDYLVQAELSGPGTHLVDAFVRYRFAPWLAVRFGQGKVEYGRQWITSSRDLQLADRSIVDGRFSVGRDQGVSIGGRLAGELFEYSLGVFNGNGINQPTNDNGRFITTARAVVTPLGALDPVEGAHDRPDSPKVALGVAVLRNGIGERGAVTDISRWNVEGAFELSGFSLVGEYHRESSEPPAADRLRTQGWYVQGGYLLEGGGHELVVRRAVVDPIGAVGGAIESRVGYNRYLHGHRVKLQADLARIRDRERATSDRALRLEFQLTL